MCVCVYISNYICFYTISSPYLLVFGDDYVLRYTGADDVVGSTSKT